MTHHELKERLLRKMADVTAAQRHVHKQLVAIGVHAEEWEEQLGARAHAVATELEQSAARNPALEMMHRQALAGRARCQQLRAVVMRRGRAKP